MSKSFVVLASFASLAYSQIPLTAQLFQLEGQSLVNNAKLGWDISNNQASSYQIQRSCSNAAYNTIATVSGNTYDDYGLPSSQTCNYRIVSSSGTSSIASVTPFVTSASYRTFDNTRPSKLTTRGNIQSQGIYYKYNYITGANSSFYIQEQTSSDGWNFSGDQNVISSDVICAPIKTRCHLERITFLQHPETKIVVMWGHLENTVNYGLGQVACAYGSPGKGFTSGGTYRPLGHDSRDLTFWADDKANGYTAYLFSSTNVNSNMNIYKLTANWTAIDSLANTILINKYREAPTVVKNAGYYYLYTSRASGWYPSEPNVIASANISSNWTNPVNPAEAATYCSQSGSVLNIGSSYAMMSDRYSAQWNPSAGTDRGLLLPVSFDTSGHTPYSRYHFYKTVKAISQNTNMLSSSTSELFGIQTGRILSVSKPLIASPGSNVRVANDGVDNDPNSYYTPTAVPFSLIVDLQQPYNITQVDLSVRMVQGSETYYKYTVVGSNDNSTYTELYNASNNTDVGFTAHYVSGSYRYVGVRVTSVTNTINGNAADWARGVREIKVYGGN